MITNLENIVCCADLHLQINRPQFRVDDYFTTECAKLKQIVSIANRNQAALIIAGDIFDHVRVGHKVVNTVIRALKNVRKGVFVVAGQHDMSYHSQDLISSPLQTILFDNNIHLLSSTPTMLGMYKVYGASFGQEVPVANNSKNILVIHKSITDGEPPFFLPDAVSAKTALSQYKNYKFIVSGDYHESFILRYKERLLINCGPMMRKNVTQKNFRPSVWVLNTYSGHLKRVYLKIEKKEKVFLAESKQSGKNKHFSKEMQKLLKTFTDKQRVPSFPRAVDFVMDKENVDPQVKELVLSILGEQRE